MDFKIEHMIYNEYSGNIGFVLVDTSGTEYNWIDIHKNKLDKFDRKSIPLGHPWIEIKELIVFKFKDRLYRMIKTTNQDTYYLQVVSVSKNKDTNMLITGKEYEKYYAEFNSYLLDNKDEVGFEFVCLKVPDVQQFVFASAIIENEKLTKIILDKESEN